MPAAPKKTPSRPEAGGDGPSRGSLEVPRRAEVQLRRSSRLLHQPPGDAGSEDTDGIYMHDMHERRETAKGDVQLAIEGLERMEHRLRTAARRHRLQIEESCFHSTRPGDSKNDATERASTDNAREEGEEAGVADEGGRGAARTPPVNSGYLPLPWRGRLGYACLNTYLRTARRPVFCSRTCRIASIVEHRHPLADPGRPEHAVRNRPDRTQAARRELGERFVRGLGLANARDLVRMLRWNERYGIRFLRLSSGMFPFASHAEHGYRLAPFASGVLAEAGRVAAELGHRVTTHPGQFTQLGSPRREVVEAAVRELEYHDELLTLLRLPAQQDRDAVVVLHMGGVYGDRAATAARFRANYAALPASVRARLVLENDDVGWGVHDLLPLCEELGIPLVLDYHHHNIVFDRARCREGTRDISRPELQERIAATWRRKGIRQKMHYSEPCAGAVTPRERRKHSPRVATLPPCPPDMDLMIEAKDKEQAVFELMRAFKLPGFERINDMIPHERHDEPPRRSARSGASTTAQKQKQKPAAGLKRKRAPDEEDPVDPNEVGAAADDEYNDADYAMGGPDNRVYWPPGREDWLKPARKGAAKPLKTEDLEDEC